MNPKTIEAKVKKALVVDDNQVALDSISKFIEDLGYDVKKALSNEEAIKYKNEKLDLVIIDGLYGRCFEVCKELKAERKIIFSGDYHIVEKAKSEGKEAYFKPNLPEDI